MPGSSNSVYPHGYAVVRIVVAGDPQTGKSTLIHAAAYKFPNKTTPVLPPYCDGVPVQIIDTSSRTKDRDRVNEELQSADVVVLTYACDRPETLENISTFWLPRLRNLEVKVPVIVASCKLDLQYHNQEVSLEEAMSPLIQEFHEIESYIECSAFGCFQVFEVFYLAQKAALYPTNPLYDKESKTLKPRCARALKRIFILCDHDKDGALNDVELNDFQVKCFNAPFQPREISDVKTVVNTFLSKGVDERGLTLAGFLCLHILFMEKGPLETTWTVLRKFGYNNDMKLGDDFIPPLKRAPDQSVELTNKAIKFLKTIFDEYDGDSDKVLQPSELEELFSTAPESPWIENPYKDALARNEHGGLSVDAFLSQWALMAPLNPTFCMENLIYIGYPGDPLSALRVTRKRHVDRQKQHSERNVLQCFVFGPMQTGKSALLNSSIRRPYIEIVNPIDEDRYAVHVIDISRENKKYLVMREISEGGVTKLLANKESLASCDIAVFVHDRFDESSQKASSELLLKIAGHGEDTGFQVPCLIVAAKDDKDSLTMAIQDATTVGQDMRVEAHTPTNVMPGDFNNIFREIVNAAEHPHLSIPKIETGKTRKQYHNFIDRSIMLFSVGIGAAVAIGVAAARKTDKKKKGL